MDYRMKALVLLEAHLDGVERALDKLLQERIQAQNKRQKAKRTGRKPDFTIKVVPFPSDRVKP